MSHTDFKSFTKNDVDALKIIVRKVNEDEDFYFVNDVGPHENSKIAGRIDNVHAIEKQSNIPNAGNGLFAKKDCKKGTHVATYAGVAVPTSFYKKDFMRKSIFFNYGFELKG